MLRWLLLRVYRIPPTATSPTPDDLGLAGEDVTLTAADGSRLRGWFLPADAGTDGAGTDGTGTDGTARGTGTDATGTGTEGAAPDAPATGSPAVVILHGWGSTATDLLPAAPALVAAGLPTLLLDARGHGRSDRVDFMSMPRFAEDLATAVAWLRADPRVDPDRIAVVGHSVGAGACLLAAAQDPRIAAVIAIASMAHPAELIRTSRGLRPAPTTLADRVLGTIEDTIGHRFDDFAPVRTIARIDAPVLVVHGLADRTVPVRDAHRLADAGGSSTRLRLVPGADHRSVHGFLPVVGELAGFLHDAVGHDRPDQPLPPTL